MESATWRAGVRASAVKTFSFRGDSIFYVPGTSYQQTYQAAAGRGPLGFTNAPAFRHNESGDDLYALCVTQFYTDGTFKRLFYGVDYTNTATGISLVDVPPAGSYIKVIYGSATAGSFPASALTLPPTKPAAVRGRSVDVYVALNTATPTLVLWRGVQTAEVNLRLNLQADDELGNPHAVDRDYDDPEVSGTLTVRPSSPQYLFDRIAQVTNTPANEIAGIFSSQQLDMQIRFNHPDTGVTMETVAVSKARFTPPPLSTQVGQRMDVPFAFTSDSADVKVYQGTP